MSSGCMASLRASVRAVRRRGDIGPWAHVLLRKFEEHGAGWAAPPTSAGRWPARGAARSRRCRRAGARGVAFGLGLASGRDRRGAAGGCCFPSTTGPVHGRGGYLAARRARPEGAAGADERRRDRDLRPRDPAYVRRAEAPPGLASPAPEGGRRARPGSAQLRGRAAPPPGRGGSGIRDLVHPAAHRHPPAEGTALGRSVSRRGGLHRTDVRVRGDGDRFHPAHPPLRRGSDGPVRLARRPDPPSPGGSPRSRSDRYSGPSLPSRPR